MNDGRPIPDYSAPEPRKPLLVVRIGRWIITGVFVACLITFTLILILNLMIFVLRLIER